jgi:hypothetical protein
MSDFWNNISRYPRFFISSLVGSVLVILAPLRNLFKVKSSALFCQSSFPFFIHSYKYGWFIQITRPYKILKKLN